MAETHRRQGLGRELLQALFDVARQLGCSEAWVLTERNNGPACRLYGSIGGVQDTGETTMFEFRLGS